MIWLNCAKSYHGWRKTRRSKNGITIIHYGAIIKARANAILLQIGCWYIGLWEKLR